MNDIISRFDRDRDGSLFMMTRCTMKSQYTLLYRESDGAVFTISLNSFAKYLRGVPYWFRGDGFQPEQVNGTLYVRTTGASENEVINKCENDDDPIVGMLEVNT